MSTISSTATTSPASTSPTESMQEHAGVAIDSVKDATADVARSASDHAKSLLRTAGDELRERGQDEAKRASSSLSQVAQDLRQMADASGSSSMVGDLVRSIADTAQRVSRRLDEGGPDGVLQDVARYGRRHPARFVAVATASGFAAARLVRSTDNASLRQAVAPSTGDAERGHEADAGREAAPTPPPPFNSPSTAPPMTPRSATGSAVDPLTGIPNGTFGGGTP